MSFVLILICCLGIMPANKAKKVAAPPVAIPAATPALAPGKVARSKLKAIPLVVTPGAIVPGAQPAVGELDDPTASEADAEAIGLGFAQSIAAQEAQVRAARVADLVKAGIESVLAERNRLAAIDKASREAAAESSEINAAIEAGIAEADRASAMQDKTTKRKAHKAALAEAARVEALRLAAFHDETDGVSDDELVIMPSFIPPPPSARELAVLAKSKVKPLKAVTGIPTAADVAALKAVVAQKEILKEYESLQRRDALLSGVNTPFDPHAAAVTGDGCYPKCGSVYSHIFPSP